MKKVRFDKVTLHKGRIYNPGTVGEFRDSVVAMFVATGAGHEVSPSVRSLKYAVNAPLTVECVVETDDAIESAPKGVTKKTPKTNTKIKE